MAIRLAEFSFPALVKDLLQQGYSLRCRTLGTSMLPIIRSGNIIEVEPVDAQELRVGDVVMYHNFSESLVAHRLIKKSLVQGKIVLTTRGDGFPRNWVESVEPDQVLGRVVAVEWGKRWKIRLSSTSVKLLGLLLTRILPPFPLVYWLIQIKHGCRLLLRKIES